MPNFQINNDNYIKDYHLSFRTEFEIKLEKFLNHPILNKLKLDDNEFNINKLEVEVNKFIQIHSLKCKQCKLKKKTCYVTSELINLFEVIL
jgi:hypothetical protein